ncbi:MAG TPA: molybdopterin cofactor-binding domain-containing protein [Thermoanaerobaculia bacterium]
MNESYFAGRETAASERRDRCRRIVETNAPALAVTTRLLSFANRDPNSPFRGVIIDDIEMLDGRLRHKSDPARSLSIADIMRRHNLTEITETRRVAPLAGTSKYASLAHGAQFVEVKVDPDLGHVRVTRAVEVTACGKILNPKASHSQEIGGVVWGIGMALQEATEIDHRYGHIMNPDLQHYHVPSTPTSTPSTLFVEEEDRIINPLGVKGMGELGMVGIPAAIANAVFHATGRRVRDCRLRRRWCCEGGRRGDTGAPTFARPPAAQARTVHRRIPSVAALSSNTLYGKVRD